LIQILIDGDSIAYKAANCAKESITLMNRIIDDEMGTILRECESVEYELYIEDPIKKDIFRNDIAVTKPYKGSRAKLSRPPLLLQAKEYMIKWWNAITTHRYESEDMVVRRAYQIGLDSVIVAAIDKDLKMHPFQFYNYRTQEHFKVSKEEADLFLWQQVATGDSCDDIPGIPGIGPKKAGVVTDMETCVQLYKLRKCSYKYFIEQYNLIYIRKEMNDIILYPLSATEWDKIQT
jgi:hypothetical protein